MTLELGSEKSVAFGAEGLAGLESSPVIEVGSVPFRATTLDDAATWLLQPAGKGRGQSVRLGNAYCVSLAAEDADYGRLLRSSGLNLPDGAPVSWIMKLKSRGADIRPRRVRGPSLFEQALNASQGSGTKHFLLGTTAETLDKLVARIAAKYPGAEVAGHLAPPFSPLTEGMLDEWAQQVRASGATLVWVGLGTPKQDHASTGLAQRLDLHCVGVGAAFDFLAGTQREAPRVVQALALEWLFRFATEPRRLWRRYTTGNAMFLLAVTRKPR